MNRDSAILSLGPLVRGIARRVSRGVPSSILFEDLVSEGWIGACKAVDSYEPNRGELKAFASAFVKGAMLSYVGEMLDNRRHEGGGYTRPTLISIDGMQIEDCGKFAAGLTNSQLVQQKLDLLDERSRYICEQHFLCGRTQDDLAREFGFVNSRISQIVAVSLRRMGKREKPETEQIFAMVAGA